VAKIIKKKCRIRFRNALLEFNSKEDYNNFKNLSDHIDLLDTAVNNAKEEIEKAKSRIEHFSAIERTRQAKSYKLKKIQQAIISRTMVKHD
jgi:ElaB/YqjD/DUF883 family membrane-anchored ribosome-binding protein